ncbi:MAG: large-conductance mechanosensitive channel [Flavobacteriales bacterium]|jgi:large-conductance mechanosensitive channel
MGLIRFLAVAAIVYYVVRLFNRVRKKDRFEAYEAGRQANTKQEGPRDKSSKKKKASDDDLGEYVEFEEVKD